MGFDGSHTITSFTITPKHYMGCVLEECDGNYNEVPRLYPWRSLKEYLQLFPDIHTAPILPWLTLISLFASIEIITEDLPHILSYSGRSLPSDIDWDLLFHTCSTPQPPRNNL